MLFPTADNTFVIWTCRLKRFEKKTLSASIDCGLLMKPNKGERAVDDLPDTSPDDMGWCNV